MGYLTTDDVLKKWEAGSSEYREKKREIEDLKKDLSEARGIIRDAVSRYKKKKLRVRSLKAAEEDPFKDLALYSSKTDIQDAYGMDVISQNEMFRLWDLWDAREESKGKEGKYEDRVTKIVEAAIDAVTEAYYDDIADFEHAERERRKEAEAFAEKNNVEERKYRYGI